MKKRFLFFFPSLIILFVALGFLSLDNFQEPQVCFEEHCFQVELAKTNAERAGGLMFREYLDEDSGMLFIYDKEERLNFWMKNTLIPLDIIWINSEKEVVYMERNAQPCNDLFCDSINPGIDAQYVLELNAGKATEIGLSVGDKLEFDI